PSKMVLFSASARNAAAEALASLARVPCALQTHQCTSSLSPAPIQVRSVPPAPISMSSECAPRQRTDRRSPGRASPNALIASFLGPATIGPLLWRRGAPRHSSFLDHVLKNLPIAKSVHG